MGDADTPIAGGFSAAAAPTWRAAYSDRTAAIMARLCELAYESAELPTAAVPAADAAPAPDARSRSALATALEEIGFTLAGVFTHASTRGYLAISPQFAVLAFRGTANLADWGIDVDALMAELTLPNGRGSVRVHEGFLHAWQGCADKIAEGLATHMPPGLGLYVTGHSLGGGLAQIASAALERDALAACYTFGSPRVGELEFDTVVKCPHYRVVDHWDVVPTVPPPFYRGYLHSGHPRLIRRDAVAALRRDRSPALSAVVNLVGLANLIATRRALIVEDHMIARYREVLEVIARERQTAVATPTSVRRLPNGAATMALIGAAGLALGLSLRRRRG